MEIKAILAFVATSLAALIAMITGAYNVGKKSQKNKQTENNLRNAEESAKFKQNLDAVSIADKRKFLRNKFPKK